MKYLYVCLFFISCGLQKNLNYSSENINPVQDFEIDSLYFEIDYSKKTNWAFRSDTDDFKKLIPKNYKIKNEVPFDVSVFFIHPTSLFSSVNWNADTLHFKNNEIIDLSLENQASVFAGLTELYVPHYREMHIHSYSDKKNGFKAFDFAYKDILSAFKYFIKNIKTKKFIIASHSQGTNHAKKLINEYIILNENLNKNLILSYMIGMDIKENEMKIDLCENPNQLNCFLNWRSFNNLYYPNNWNYGEDYVSINPINFSTKFSWSNRKNHKGILFPNKKIYFSKSISARNEKGILWIKFPKNLFMKKFKRNSYHNADYNLFWINIRSNLINRLSQL